MNITIDDQKLSYDIFSKKNSQINFKSTKRSIIDNNSVKIVGNYTNMFRNDINWDKLIDLIIETDCKHIYSLACSDDSEAYSIAIALIERLGRNAKRFKPIIASDSNQYIINEANSGYINLRNSDIAKINQITRNNFSKYFEDIGEPTGKDGYKKYKVNKILKNFVKFKKSDAIDFSNEEISSNSLIMLRNFWAYLPIQKQKELAKNLYKNSQTSTYIILGSFDLTHTNAAYYLIEEGFKLNRKQINLPDDAIYNSKYIGECTPIQKITNGVLYK